MVDITIEMVQRPAALLAATDVQGEGLSDTDVAELIATAHEVLEASLSRLVGERVYKITYGQWTGSAVLPHDPTQIISVLASDAPATYITDGRILTVRGEGPVSITYQCGWSSDTAPAGIKAALKVIVADLVKNPEVLSGTTLYFNQEVEALVALYRLMR